ncbi:hypothetical protein BDN72DRAFT_893841 [Pluteus cervinus]|uniref:Uncharacterized protein n=1 Tax=Pluteus cervinus TaxID=181527 RepID=A0ACD3B7Q2_9AGAR|nr:hypothetical protein BDN72DRAFT_893841 [Pluteus cervinus]
MAFLNHYTHHTNSPIPHPAMRLRSSKHSLPFNDDVVDYLLCALPDFESLSATIRASKAFLHVFHAHKKTIIREVCYNIVPALPQALRVVRFKMAIDDNDLDEPTIWPEVPEVGPETDQLGIITKGEVKYLLEYASDMRRLEDFFSYL